MNLSSKIKKSWMKRKQLLGHDFAVSGRALSILPEIDMIPEEILFMIREWLLKSSWPNYT